jgi:uncharacterized repeat protein (TIGR01451 family)
VTDPLAGLSAITCDGTTIAVGGFITCSATYAVTQADIDAGFVYNMATADSDESGPDDDDNNEPLPQNPLIMVVKSSTTTSVDHAGQVVAYTFIVTNTGNVTLTGISVSDPNCDATPTFVSGDLNADSKLQIEEAWTYTCDHTVTQAEIDNNGNGISSVNIALGANPLESNAGWGGGSYPWDITDGKTAYNDTWAHGLAFTGGIHSYMGQTCGYRQATVNLGSLKQFSRVLVWHHGTEHVPTLYGVDYWNGSQWLPAGGSSSLRTDLQTTSGSGSVPTETIFPAVTGSKVRFWLNNCNIEHGWIYEFEVFGGGGNGTLSNTVTADSNESGPDTDDHDIPINYNPMIDVEKSSTTTLIDHAGQLVPYTFVVTNTGNVTLTGVTVTDPLITPISCPTTTLLVGESMTCTGAYTVGQTNIDTNGGGDGDLDNTVTADSNESGSDTDDYSIPITYDPKLSLNKTGVFDAGMDGYADVGELITYTFVVTNTGNVTLHNVTVTDPLVGLSAITCDGTTIAVGGFITCSATYAVTQADIDAGTVHNMATADSDESSPDGDDETVTLPQNPVISIVKSGIFNSGDDAYADPGEIISYEFLVTNEGNVTLTNITVTDPLVGLSAITCPFTTLAVGANMTCTATYAVNQADIDAGTVHNMATADSKESGPDDDDETVTLPQNPAIDLDKVTVDGTTKDDGLNILTGESITWEYKVKNIGNVTLFNISVADDQGVTVSCPALDIAGLKPGFSITCTATGTAAKDLYENIGTVTAKDPQGDPATDDDASSYFGADPQISIAKVTVDGASSGDGLNILTGESIKWRYTVTNAGNVALSNVTVTDNKPGVSPAYVSGDTDGDGKLDLTETWIFEASGTASAGSYSNTGTASGKFTDSAGHSRTDTATDISSYFGANPQIDIVKKTVGSDGTEGDNVFILINGAVTWKYYVTNTGNIALTNVTVTDNQPGVTVTCPQTTLAIGASMTCTANGTNTTPIGTWYNNVGTATSNYTDTAGHSRTATDSDPSAYYSGAPGDVTNSQLCNFGPNFRLVFTPDSRYYTSTYQAFKLSDSNPGQFFYNLFYTNGGDANKIILEIPYPFVTQGAMPVHVYGGLTVNPNNSGTPSPDNLTNCFVPTNTLASYGSIITLSSYSDTNNDGKVGFGDMVRVNVPAAVGFQYINIHLDYGLEKTDRWIKQGSNANTDTTIYPTRPNIKDLTPHTFKAYVNAALPSNLISGSTDTVYNQNEFKQVRGFGGLVYQWNDGLNDYIPVPGAKVRLYKGTNLLETMTTDNDGWYLSNYVHKGKAATYKLALLDANGNIIKTIQVTAGGSLKFGEGIFYIGGPAPTP